MDVRKLVLSIVLLAGGSRLEAQERLSRAEATEDVRYVINVLEEIHPDPYSAFGGKVKFKRKAQALLDSVPQDGLTPAGVYDLLRPLFGELGDGHTYISSPPTQGPSDEIRYLPVRFGIATDAIFVESTMRVYEELIGYRLMAVEGIPVAHAAELAATVHPAENLFGARRWLLSHIVSRRAARRIFPHVQDSLSVELVSPSGERVERRLPYSLEPAAYRDGAWIVRRSNVIASDPGPFFWRFIGDSSVAYLRVVSIVGREAFEELRAVGRQDLREQVAAYYRRYSDKPMPEGIDDAIGGVPCFTGAVRDLLSAMRERGSEHLILDLRENGGGWSALVAPFLLLTYGDRYFNYDFPVTFVTRISRAYLELSGRTLEELNAQLGSDYEIGDYHFVEEESLASTMSNEEYAARLEPYGCNLATDFRELGGRAVHTPSVVVLVDPGTFSAAYHFVYRLWHLGAKMVGVPSAQAGNAFVDVTRFQLPHSKLGGSVARTAQILYPDNEEGGRVLMPDFPMEWRDFERYGFDEHSEVRFALDLIAAGWKR